MFEKFPVPFTKLKRLLVQSFVNWPLLPTGDPSNARHPANKGYVDTQVSAATAAVGLTLIESKTASSSATIDFTTGIDSTYDEYQIHYWDVMPATDNVALWLQVSKDAGVNWRSTAGDYRHSVGYVNTVNTGNTNSASDTKIQINRGVGNASNRGCAGQITFWNPSGTSRNKWFQLFGQHVDNTGVPEASNGRGAFILDNAAINGIRLLFSSGNIASGTFKLYGVKK